MMRMPLWFFLFDWKCPIQDWYRFIFLEVQFFKITTVDINIGLELEECLPRYSVGFYEGGKSLCICWLTIPFILFLLLSEICSRDLGWTGNELGRCGRLLGVHLRMKMRDCVVQMIERGGGHEIFVGEREGRIWSFADWAVDMIEDFGIENFSHLASDEEGLWSGPFECVTLPCALLTKLQLEKTVVFVAWIWAL